MMPGDDLLSIYLNDHLAGSVAGVELVRRSRSTNEGTALGAFLARLQTEIEQDRAELEDMMRTLGVERDRAKLAAAWAGEKLGRLKLNGRLLSRSPLSRLVELEALELGVDGKLLAWQALRRLADRHGGLEASRLERLIERAERQLEGIREQHLEVASEALAE
jgi:hypothetical protein